MGLFSRRRGREDAAAGSPASTIYPLLFGDVPLAAWRPEGADGISVRFQAACAAIEQHATAHAIDLLTSLANDPDVDSRDSLQAWAALRELGVPAPPEQASRALGIVVQMPVAGGLDTLAAYADGSARYLNHAGKIGIVESASGDFEPLIDRLVGEGQTLANRIGAWDGPRPELPAGMARISVLCPGGLHFGQGPPGLFTTDPLAAPVIDAATALLVSIVDHST